MGKGKSSQNGCYLIGARDDTGLKGLTEEDTLNLNSVFNDIPVTAIEFHGPGHDASI